MVAHSLGVLFSLYAVREGVAAERVVAISGVAEFQYLVDTFCKDLGLRPSVNPALRRSIETKLFEGNGDIWTRASPAQPAECDLLIVQDDLDRVVIPSQAALLVAAYGARARLVATSGLGHGRILTAASVVDEAMEFLTATSPAESTS